MQRAIYAHRPRFSRLKERRCFHARCIIRTSKRGLHRLIGLLLTRDASTSYGQREREKEREGENEGDDVVCSILHFVFHPLASCLHVEFQLPPSIVRTRTHRYICILAGSFSGSGSMRTSISASMYLQPFLEGFARSVSVFDHHSLPSHRCLTISRQQFNYLPCSRFRFPRSFDFSLVTGYKDISSSMCSYCVDLL